MKQKYPNNIVLYRVGDFFEVLGEDAKSVAEWADLTLTSRNDPNSGRVSMVGFPFHTLDRFVEKIRVHQAVTLVQEGGVIKEYPMAPMESSKNGKPIETKNNTVGGINNAEQRSGKETEDERRTDSSASGSNERTLPKDGDGRELSKGSGEKAQNRQENRSKVGQERPISGEKKNFLKIHMLILAKVPLRNPRARFLTNTGLNGM